MRRRRVGIYFRVALAPGLQGVLAARPRRRDLGVVVVTLWKADRRGRHRPSASTEVGVRRWSRRR